MEKQKIDYQSKKIYGIYQKNAVTNMNILRLNKELKKMFPKNS